MNNMKAYIFLICTIIITAGFACNKALEPSDKSNMLESLQSQYAEIGEQHNASLDHVMDGFGELAQKGRKMTSTEIAEFAVNKNHEYIRSLYESDELKKVVTEAYENEINLLFGEMGKRKELGVSFSQRLEGPNIQSVEKEYLQMINEIVENSKSHEEVQQNIAEILKEAEADLEEEELKTVVLSAEVAVASSQFWIDNGEEWFERIKKLKADSTSVQDMSQPTLQYMDWSALAKADIGGAVTGVMGAFITGCGQMTAGACAGAGALGGAAVGSVGYATRVVLDRFFINDPIAYPELTQKQ